MANTKVTGDLIASGTITADNLVSGTLDALLNSYLTTNTYATQGYVTTAVNNLIDAAPASLDTLNELAAALNDDANFATTVTNALATKLNLSGGTLTGDLGIGTSPSAKLDILGATQDQLRLRTAGTEHYRIGRDSSNGLLYFYGSQSGYTGYVFDGVNGERMRIDSSGNVGIGVTPSSWSLSGLTALQIKNGGFYGFDLNEVGVTANAYYNGGWKYISSDSASMYLQDTNSNHVFRHASSGTADGAITWSESMRIDSSGQTRFKSSTDYSIGLNRSGVDEWWLKAYTSGAFAIHENGIGDQFTILSGGNVGIGTTSPNAKLHVNGGTGENTTKVIIGGNDAILRLGDNQGGGPHGFQFDGFQTTDGMSIYYRTTPQQICFEDSTGTSGNKVMVVGRNGNIGIGTTSPEAILHTSAPYPTYTDYGTVFYGGTTNNSSQNGIMLASAGNALSGVIGSNLFVNGTNWSQTNTGRSTGWLSMVNTTVAGQTSTLRYNGYVKGTNTTVERFIIDGNGRVGIGTNAPASIFHLKQDAPVLTSESTNTVSGFRINVLGGGSQLLRVQNAGTTKFQIDPNGGIYLGGSTAAANALDDYEEGTWTPQLFGSSGAGSYSLSSVTAKYIKIGSLVYLTAVFSVTVNSAGSGYAVIGNIPFGKGFGQHAGSVETRGYNHTDGITNLTLLFTTSSAGSTNLYLSGMRDNSTSIDEPVTGFSTGDKVYMSITYSTF